MKNRFEVVEKEGNEIFGPAKFKVIVDTLTGVNYLFVESGYAGGLTALLDEDGKPIITDFKQYQQY